MDDLPHNVTLRNELVLLRPWIVADAQWYVESRDEEIFRWTKERRDLTVRETEEVITQVNSGGNAICFAIVDAVTHKLLGNLALEVDQSTGQGEVMYWLASWGRGRGAATNAVNLLTTWAFEKLTLKKIILKTMIGNEASQRVAERAGFQPTPSPPSDEGWAWFELTRDIASPREHTNGA